MLLRHGLGVITWPAQQHRRILDPPDTLWPGPGRRDPGDARHRRVAPASADRLPSRVGAAACRREPRNLPRGQHDKSPATGNGIWKERFQQTVFATFRLSSFSNHPVVAVWKYRRSSARVASKEALMAETTTDRSNGMQVLGPTIESPVGRSAIGLPSQGWPPTCCRSRFRGIAGSPWSGCRRPVGGVLASSPTWGRTCSLAPLLWPAIPLAGVGLWPASPAKVGRAGQLAGDRKRRGSKHG